MRTDLGTSLAVFAIAVVILLILKERFRRMVQGYYVYMRGGVEGGDVKYNESGKELNFSFTRRNRTIYIPSQNKWDEIMPDWARGKRDLIIARIRKRVSKTWKFEEADNQERVRPQSAEK